MAPAPILLRHPELPDEAAGPLKKPAGEADGNKQNKSDDAALRPLPDIGRIFLPGVAPVHLPEQAVPVSHLNSKLRKIPLERPLKPGV